MSLFDFDEAIEKNCFDDDGHVIDAELKAIFEEERDDAVERTGMVYKKEDAILNDIKEEIAKLQKRAKVHQNRRDGVKSYLDRYLAGRKFETAKLAISYRKSEAVEVAEGASVPDEFLVEQAPKIDKIGLKKALKGGAVIEGVSLVERQNIQIK